MSRRLLLPVLALLCLVASVAYAQESAQELAFYNHPTNRYNVLIPSGWENLSTDTYAHLRSSALNADLWAFSLSDTDTDSAAAAALAIALPDVSVSPIPADDVTLTTGTWAQRLYALPDGAAATAFVQTIDDLTYTVLYVAADGTQVFVQPIEAAIEDEAGALAAIEAGLTTLGLENLTLANGDVIEPLADGSNYTAAYINGDESYTVFVRPSSITTADLTIGKSDSFNPDHRIALTVVRDFFITPDTTTYYLLGLAAVALVMALFVALLGARWRNLQKDEAALKQLISE